MSVSDPVQTVSVMDKKQFSLRNIEGMLLMAGSRVDPGVAAVVMLQLTTSFRQQAQQRLDQLNAMLAERDSLVADLAILAEADSRWRSRANGEAGVDLAETVPQPASAYSPAPAYAAVAPAAAAATAPAPASEEVQEFEADFDPSDDDDGEYYDDNGGYSDSSAVTSGEEPQQTAAEMTRHEDRHNLDLAEKADSAIMGDMPFAQG